MRDPKPLLDATRLQATVESTSPTTTTHGPVAGQHRLKRCMTWAVCSACDPEPTSRLKWGGGRCEIPKEASDIPAS